MKKIILTFATIFILTACSDDNVTPPDPNTNYFGTGDNSTWIYAIDTVNIAQKNGKFEGTDVLIQLKDSIYSGRNAKYMQYICRNPLNTPVSKQINYFMYENGSKVYVSSHLLSVILPDYIEKALKISEINDWINLTDGNVQSKTEIFSKNLNIDSLGMTTVVSLYGACELVITRKENKKIKLKNGDQDVHVFNLRLAFDGKYTVKNSEPSDELVFATDLAEIDFYFKPKEGLLGIYSYPREIEIDGFLGGEETWKLKTILGYQKLLTEATVVKAD